MGGKEIQEKGLSPRLESWKEIAAYIHRDIRTSQRWEKELGLPVHRLTNHANSRVFAYKDEIDRWLESETRRGLLAAEDKESRKLGKRWFYTTVLFILMLGVIALYWTTSGNRSRLRKLGEDVVVLPRTSAINYLKLAWTGNQFGVVWKDSHEGEDALYFKIITATGRPLSPDIRLSEIGQKIMDKPSIVWNNDEKSFAVVYQAGNPADLYFVKIDESWKITQFPTPITHDPFDSGGPDMAWTGNGYALIWSNFQHSLQFAMLRPDGTPAMESVTIDGGYDPRYPSLAWNGVTRECAVAWNADVDGKREIYVALLDAQGRVKKKKRVSSYPGWKEWPAITWAGKEYGLVWRDQSTGFWEIFFARIDEAGNILDPGPVPISARRNDCQNAAIVWSGDEYGVAYSAALSTESWASAFIRLDARGRKIGKELVFSEPSSWAPAPALVWGSGFYGTAWISGADQDRAISFNRLSANGAVNLGPVIKFAPEIVKTAGPDGMATVTPEEMDRGSYDPEEGKIELKADEGPYPVGSHNVSLFVRDPQGKTAMARVTLIVRPFLASPSSRPKAEGHSS